MIIRGDVGGTTATRAVARVDTIFNATAFTGAQAIDSTPIDMGMAPSRLILEIVSTGTPTGTYTIVGSNQYDPVANTGATFVTQSAAATPAFPVPAGAGAQTMHAVFNTNASGQGRWVRLRYTNTSGTGTLSAYAFVAPV